jgi:hypothetical protein
MENLTEEGKELIKKRREELREYSEKYKEVIEKMEYIIKVFRKDPTLIRYIHGALGYKTELNDIVFELAIDQVYSLCKDSEKIEKNT